jgi:RNA-directed DNA polymerase
MLSNLVAKRLDEDLDGRAVAHGLIYTRYSDDLAFSTSSRDFTRENARAMISDVYALLRPHGFRPNLTKSAVVPPGARRIVLGLLVDSDRPRLSREYRETLDTHLYHLRMRGAPAHAASRGFRSVVGMLRHVRGLVDYAKMVEPAYGEEALELFRSALSQQGLLGND